MLVPLAVHVLICAVAENGSNFIAVRFLPGSVQFFENIIILPQGLNGIHGKKGSINILALGVDMLLMMLKDMLRDLPDPLIGMIEFININVMPLAILRVVQLLRINAPHCDMMGENRSLILHGETKDIPIGNGVLDHIAMQAGITLGTIRHQSGIEHVGSRPAIGPLIRLKNRCSREADIIRFLEVAVNIPVHFPKLTAMALVNDENDLLITVGIHQGLITLRLHGVGHLLDRGDDELAVGIHQGFIPLRLHGIRHLLDRCDNQLTVRILELPDQDKGTVRIIDTILFKGIVFIHRLVIEILAVNEENHLINARLVAQELGQLERSQGFTGAGARKDIAVLIGLQDPATSGFHSEDLIRTHHHQDRLGRLDDHELVDHLGKGGLPEELRSKLFQCVDAFILLICPEEYQRLQDRIIKAI